MDEIVVLVGLLLIGPWVLGIVAFFRAGRALRDLRELRKSLAQVAQRPPVEDRPAAFVPSEAAGEKPASEFLADIEGRAPPEVSIPPAEPPPLPPPLPESGPEPESSLGPVPAPIRPKRDLESLITMQWGLWLGALALLMSGVFLIRYAVDQGFFGPTARCAAAAALGLALLYGAEWLRRKSARSEADSPAAGTDQAPAALAAGGIAVLFGAAYGIGPYYDLVPAPVAFVLLAGVAMAGLAVSLRFGQLVAAIGLVGAYVTPLLVQTDAPSLPGLFAYLLVVTAASLAVVRHTAWTWLGWATTLASALWALAGGGLAGHGDIWAPSLFVPATAALNLFLLPRAALEHPVGRRLSWIPFAVLGGVGLMLETASSAASPRIGVLLLVPLAVGKAVFEPRLDRLPWLASLLFLLSLLLWALPDWQPTGETISIEGVVQAVLPGAWAPAVIVPLLLTAAGMAAFLAAAGLAMERRATDPLRWAALPAAVPLLTLAVTYIQVKRFQPDMVWAFAALALTAFLVFTTHLAMRDAHRQRAGVHAAGAVAALALACAMVLQDQWLTLAISLFLPALAWIEAWADLPPLRKVALVVAGLVLVRLLLNWYVLDYGYGALPIVNSLLAAYGVPSVAFAAAAILFRRRADDRAVAVLESGAVLFASVLVAMEIRHWEGSGNLRGQAGLDEFAFHVGTMGIQAFVNLNLARRTGRKVLDWAWRIQGALALGGGALLICANPMVTSDYADTVTLLVGYLLPVCLAVAATRLVPPGRLAGVLGAYAVIGGLAWLGLEIRALFHPGALGLDQSPVEDAELWAWTGASLVYGAALLAVGIVIGGRTLRMAALAIIALVSAKVFLVDMAGLTGLWRVASFLGLGLALIALGAIYRRFVVPRDGAA